MSNEERTTKLRAATALILQVRDSFSNEKVICECCGMVSFPHWNEKQMRDQLNGAITRLERVEERMLNTEGRKHQFEPNEETE